MNARQLARLFTETTDTLARCETILGERLAAMVDATNGQPRSANLEAFGSGGIGDRTGNDALAPDPSHADRRKTATTVRDLHRLAVQLEKTLAAWGRRQSTPTERATTAEAQGHHTEGCASCARTTSTPGVARWEPMWKRLRANPDAEPLPLCRWCGGRLRDTGKWPTVADVEAHWRSERVTRSA